MEDLVRYPIVHTVAMETDFCQWRAWSGTPLYKRFSFATRLVRGELHFLAPAGLCGSRALTGWHARITWVVFVARPKI
jgi:hypothetical protein